MISEMSSMKKVVIIASCGLIIALVIGAASWSWTREPPHKIHQLFYEKKCTDSNHDLVPECAQGRRETLEKLSEVFLRNWKRKARVFYANLDCADRHQ
jgi:hypothetical protein